MKLHNTGVFTSVLNWLESYFTQRNQFVRIEDATSDLLPVNFGSISRIYTRSSTVYSLC